MLDPADFDRLEALAKSEKLTDRSEYFHAVVDMAPQLIAAAREAIALRAYAENCDRQIGKTMTTGSKHIEALRAEIASLRAEIERLKNAKV